MSTENNKATSPQQAGISPLASVSASAKIGKDVTIYPFAYVEGGTEIGDGSIIYPYVSILEGTTIGKQCRVHQNSVIGGIPQDFAFRGDKSRVIIGDNNVIRENVTINRASTSEGVTRIGERNWIMEGVHICHDASIGNDNVIGIKAVIGGNCVINNRIIFSTAAIANPRTRVGSGAMVAAGTLFNRDVPPYIVVTGVPATYRGINAQILTGQGVTEKIQSHIANAYRLVFHGKTSLFNAINEIKTQVPDSHEIRNIIRFLQSTELGIIGKD